MTSFSRNATFIAALLFKLLFIACGHSVLPKSASTVESDTLHADPESPSNYSIRTLLNQAIGHYLLSAKNQHHLHFDTLYLALRNVEHSEVFSEIKINPQIDDCAILVLKSEEEQNTYSSRYDFNSPMVNLIYSISPAQATFNFITFYPEFNHAFDASFNTVLLKDGEISYFTEPFIQLFRADISK